MRVNPVETEEFLARLSKAGYELNPLGDRRTTELGLLILLAEHISELRAELDALKAKQ